ncbi:Type IV pilus biogenesis protein PilQ [hydrothermal vent metagenome]|uniref:Type IV pilus biogenesis protein PilQ n=1 Tax=hydrothermal vent metagenome TaxID=652676 RepID=A0A3B0ZMI7_9ZZZZ
MLIARRATVARNKSQVITLMRRSTLFFILLMVSLPQYLLAEDVKNTLIDIGYSSLPGNRVLIKLSMENPVSMPNSFSIDTPARIALDFPETASRLKKKSTSISLGAARSIMAVEAQGRTRVVLNLIRMVKYDTRIDGNNIFITLESPTSVIASSKAKIVLSNEEQSIKNIDFRRGKNGDGRITVSLEKSASVVDVTREGGKIVAYFSDTKLPERLEQRLDVVDFATPVNFIDSFTKSGGVKIEIMTQGPFEHIAYQSDTIFTLEIRPLTVDQKKKMEKEKFGYTGEKLSLNFQNIEVRAVLQLIADFTGLNLVASDTVGGNVTLRLKNVPWDQALDLILKTKGLAMRQMGNVVLVAPAEEIAAREKQELEAEAQLRDLEPLQSEIIQVNYAKASDMAALLKAQENTMLTERGSVSVDDRTNTLLLMETVSKIVEIRALVARLDIPVRQVLIESRVVIANDNFTHEIGVKFGATGVNPSSDGMIGISGNANAIDSMATSAISNIAANGNAAPVALPALADRLSVSLPSTSTAGRFALGILGPDFMIDLELSAMQKEGKGEVLSNPRIITSNQQEAFIEQGVEIPYQEASSSGATSVSFKKAVLSLKVTPQITPDDRVIMDLNINKDSVGEIFFGTPSINTREIKTQVLVENGETVVLGGILEKTTTDGVTKVPFLGDIPYLGRLFRNDIKVDNKEELLIFITPKILKQNLNLR